MYDSTKYLYTYVYVHIGIYIHDDIYTRPRWWWRLSCRYLCRAARNPPSDDSQRHKSLVSHLSGTCFISLSSASPSSRSLLLFVSRCLARALVLLSRFPLPSPVPLLSSISPLTYPATSYRLSPLYFPYPVFVSIVPRSWWC